MAPFRKSTVGVPKTYESPCCGICMIGTKYYCCAVTSYACTTWAVLSSSGQRRAGAEGNHTERRLWSQKMAPHVSGSQSSESPDVIDKAEAGCEQGPHSGHWTLKIFQPGCRSVARMWETEMQRGTATHPDASLLSMSQ